MLWDKPFTLSGLNDQLPTGKKITPETDKANAEKTGLILTAAGKARWSVTKAASAQKTLEHIDNFIQVVDSKRAELGAIQNHSPALLIGIDW